MIASCIDPYGSHSDGNVSEKWVSGFTKLAACKIPIKNGCFADLRKQSSSTRLLCGVPFISKHRVVYKYRRNLLNIGEVSRIQTAFSRFLFCGAPKTPEKSGLATRDYIEDIYPNRVCLIVGDLMQSRDTSAHLLRE